MKALITGVCGFVGRHLAEYLRKETDWEAAGTGLGPSECIRHLRDWLEYMPADLSSLEVVTTIIQDTRPDVIFHLAAQPYTYRSGEDPWNSLETNIRMQLNVLEGILRVGRPIVTLVVGSSEEYGMVAPEENPVSENNPMRPMNPYAVSKIAQDMLGLQYYLSKGVHTVRVRPFNHIGPGQRLGFVAPDLARQVALAEAGLTEPRIRVGSLDVCRDFCDVRDVVRAYHLAVTKGQAGEVYNIGSGVPSSVRSMLEGFIQHSRASLTYSEDPSLVRPVDVPTVQADFSRFHSQTGWEPRIPFENSLLDILNDWREQVSTSRPEG